MGMDFESIKNIVDKCSELKEVCFANWDEHYSEDSIDYLANNLTTEIEKLSLAGQRFVRDYHIKIILSRWVLSTTNVSLNQESW